MVSKPVSFGIAMRNFQTYPALPDAEALIEYGVHMEPPTELRSMQKLVRVRVPAAELGPRRD